MHEATRNRRLVEDDAPRSLARHASLTMCVGHACSGCDQCSRGNSRTAGEDDRTFVYERCGSDGESGASSERDT